MEFMAETQKLIGISLEGSVGLMASEGEIAAAEAAVREAEANLQSLLGRSINNGVMLEVARRGVGIEAAAATRRRRRERQLQELRNN